MRGDPGSYAFLQEVVLAIELAGATPLPELLPGDYSRRLLTGASTEYLAEWDRRRAPLLEQVDRALTFQRPPLDLSAVPREARQAWETATDRLIRLEEERCCRSWWPRRRPRVGRNTWTCPRANWRPA